MSKLQGKVALITGASSGIGKTVAEALAAEGATIVVAARREDRLDDLVERIESNGSKALAIECDVTDEDQAHDLINRAKEELGSVDILVNNAGISLPSKIEEGLSGEWRQMFEVNVLGLLYTTDAAIGVMKEQSSGHIVNVSSLAARRTGEARGIYSATKMAVNAISEALRQELLEDNIRVSIVEPGVVETEIQEGIQERIGSMTEGIIPLQPEDIAAAISYIVTQPERVSVSEILIIPTQQP